MIVKSEQELTTEEKIESYFAQHGKDLYTTGEIATICKVASGTVCDWVDKKILEGFRIPGSQDRRVTQNQFKLFLKNYGMEEVLEENEFFWTGEVAKICKISNTAIINSYERGILKGHRLPGTHRVRRISKSTLEKVMHEYNIPSDYLTDYLAQKNSAQNL